MRPFESYFDHTLLKADARLEQIQELCRQASAYGFASVCVNGCHVRTCAEALRESGVRVCCVVGFPLGAMSEAAKLAETKSALADGASEIDMVLNIGALKDGCSDLVSHEIRLLADACHPQDALLKVIIETCLLTESEKIEACRLVTEAGADFIKTSTGFSTGGATLEDVRLMKAHVGSHVKVKAAGGIRTLEDALAFIEAGADRLGCSASVEILQAYKSK